MLQVLGYQPGITGCAALGSFLLTQWNLKTDPCLHGGLLTLHSQSQSHHECTKVKSKIFLESIKTQLLQVHGMNTPAHQAGLRAGDVLVSVQDNLVTLMTHPEVSLLYMHNLLQSFV